VEFGTLFFLLLILACPLMMVWMMRGHGGHGHEPGHSHTYDNASRIPGGSLGELRRKRAELDAEIAQFEEADDEAKTPSAV
jgi:hypothetical protein